MSLLTDIRTMLVGAGLATLDTAAPWGFFEHFRPDTPDAAVVFFASPVARPSDQTQDKKPIVNPFFQILVRGTPNDDDAAEARAKSIHDLFNDFSNEYLASGVWYLRIEPTGYFGFVKRDALGRAEFVVNALARRQA